MKREDLQPCPKCGKSELFFPSRGHVSCNKTSCMPWTESYTYKEWNNLPRHETIERLRAQLAEKDKEIKRLTEEPKLCPFCGGKLYTFAEIVELKTEIANLLSEIAGLRAKHNDYEHPQDSIDRGNRIDQLEIDKFNLKTELKRLQTGVQNILDRRDLLDRYEIASMLADIVKVFP